MKTFKPYMIKFIKQARLNQKNKKNYVPMERKWNYRTDPEYVFDTLSLMNLSSSLFSEIKSGEWVFFIEHDDSYGPLGEGEGGTFNEAFIAAFCDYYENMQKNFEASWTMKFWKEQCSDQN